MRLVSNSVELCRESGRDSYILGLHIALKILKSIVQPLIMGKAKLCEREDWARKKRREMEHSDLKCRRTPQIYRLCPIS